MEGPLFVSSAPSAVERGPLFVSLSACVAGSLPKGLCTSSNSNKFSFSEADRAGCPRLSGFFTASYCFPSASAAPSTIPNSRRESRESSSDPGWTTGEGGRPLTMADHRSAQKTLGGPILAGLFYARVGLVYASLFSSFLSPVRLPLHTLPLCFLSFTPIPFESVCLFLKYQY